MIFSPTLVGGAARAVTAAERRNLTVPAAVRDTAAVCDAVATGVHLPDPDRPALPDDPADVEQVIRDHAASLQLVDATRRAAKQFQDEATQRCVTAVRAAVPEWIAGLQAEYASLVDAVRDAAATLPQPLIQLDPARLDWNIPTHAAAYTTAEGAASQLDQLINDRADIVKIAGDDGGRDNALFAVAAPPEPNAKRILADEWQQLAPVIRQWRDLQHQPVARWVSLVRQDGFALSLATPGQARQRADQAERWRDAAVAMRSAPSRSAAETAIRQHLAATA